MSITAALHALLAGDATLAGLLATYGPDSDPAVFTVDPPPADALLPYIVTAGAVATNPFDTKTERGAEVFRDVRCYAKAAGSAKPVEDIAARVHQLLHRAPLQVDGRRALIVAASPPRSGPEEDEAYGRIVTVRVVTDPA